MYRPQNIPVRQNSLSTTSPLVDSSLFEGSPPRGPLPGGNVRSFYLSFHLLPPGLKLRSRGPPLLKRRSLISRYSLLTAGLLSSLPYRYIPPRQASSHTSHAFFLSTACTSLVLRDIIRLKGFLVVKIKCLDRPRFALLVYQASLSTFRPETVCQLVNHMTSALSGLGA